MATCTGTNIQPGAIVLFDGQPASNIVWVSSTQITCSPPPHAAGVVDVKVVNPDGSSATLVGGYTYGTFTPLFIAGCFLWLKPDAGVILTSGKVSTWSDQSGKGNDFTQATSANRPTVDAASVNGRDALKFLPGDPDFLQNTAGTWPTTAGELFVLYKNDTTTGNVPWLLGTSGDDCYLPFTGGGTNDFYDNTFRHTRRPGDIAPGAASALHVHNVRHDGTTWSNYYNTTLIHSEAVGFALPATKYFGQGVSVGAAMHLCEVIMYDHQLASSDRTQVLSYLTDRWGVP